MQNQQQSGGRAGYQTSQYQGYSGGQKPSQYNPNAYHTSNYQGQGYDKGQTQQIQNPSIGGSQPHNYHTSQYRGYSGNQKPSQYNPNAYHTSRYQGYSRGNAPQRGSSISTTGYNQGQTYSNLEVMPQNVPNQGYFGTTTTGTSYGQVNIQSQLNNCRQNIQQINQIASQLAQSEQQNRQEIEQLYQIEQDNYRRLEQLRQLEAQASQQLQQIQSMCNQVAQDFRSIESLVMNQTAQTQPLGMRNY